MQGLLFKGRKYLINQMRHLYLIICCCCFRLFAFSQTIESFNNYVKPNNQVLFVKTSSINSTRGTMSLYERRNHRKQWKFVDSFTVMVGRSGLAKDIKTNISF